MSWERFYQLEHDGPGRGLAGIRAGSLTCTATHRSLSLVRKIVSAGFAMAARPSWDLVQGILASASGSRSCRRRRVLPIGKFTPSASRPPATSWKRILYEFFLAFFVKNSRSYYVSLEYLSLNIALIIFFFSPCMIYMFLDVACSLRTFGIFKRHISRRICRFVEKFL